ncbi:hypothetical protein ACUY8K_004290 [Vibrio parahaemolyticus]
MKYFALLASIALAGCSTLTPNKYTFELDKLADMKLNSSCPVLTQPQTVETKSTDPYWVLTSFCKHIDYPAITLEDRKFHLGGSSTLPAQSKFVGYMFVKERTAEQKFGAMNKRLAPVAFSHGADYAVFVPNNPLKDQDVILLMLYRSPQNES